MRNCIKTLILRLRNCNRNGFLWLKNAGVAIPACCVEEPKPPLRLSEKRNLFKLFANDVGLLAAMYAEGIQLRILAGEKAFNIGAVYENAVAQGHQRGRIGF